MDFASTEVLQIAHRQLTNINLAGTTVHDGDNTYTTDMVTAIVASNKHYITLKGMIFGHASNNATVDLRWAQGTSDAQATILEEGSFLKFTKLL